MSNEHNLEEVLEECETSITLHHTIIRRTRYWSITATLAGLAIIALGWFFFHDDELYKTGISIGGFAITGIGLAWPLREIYNLRNRTEILKMIQNSCKKRIEKIPPPVTLEEKKDFIKKIDGLINKI